MDDRRLYVGDGIGLVDDKGRVAFPASLRQSLASNAPRGDGKDGGTAFIGVHPGLPCLRAFEPAYLRVLLDRAEQRATEFSGPEGEPNYALKQREASGEPVPFDGSGRCILPAFPRDYVNIGTIAFFYGTYDWIEIWDPATLMAAEGVHPVVQAACRFHCKQKGIAL